MPPRRRYNRCPYPGCVTTGGETWLSERHVSLVHVRCVCGWVGAGVNLGRHASQVNRYRREAGRRPTRHVRLTRLPLPQGVQ